MALRVPKTQADALGFDLARAIQDYTKARAAHARTTNKPAPSAHPLVEEIVKAHDGDFEVFNDRSAADERQTLNYAAILEARVRLNAILSPARLQLAQIDYPPLSNKRARGESLTPDEAAQLAQIEQDFAALAAVQRHAAVLAVEIEDLPEDQFSTWKPHGWPAL